MKIRKLALSTLIGIALSVPSFANSITTDGDGIKNMSSEIKEMIQDIKLDFKKLDNTTVILKFIVNDNNEIIVLGTNNSGIDQSLKSALNYKKINTKDLKHNYTYIIPVSFKIS